MPTRNVNLTDHFDRFIETAVQSGRYSNASEMVREGLRLLEQREQEDQAKIEWLRTATQEGIDDMENGRYIALNSSEEIREFLAGMRAEVTARKTGKRNPPRG
jgi:antitoxin ParD1/3/4